jgi:hypothetical protein
MLAVGKVKGDRKSERRRRERKKGRRTREGRSRGGETAQGAGVGPTHVWMGSYMCGG